MKIGYKGLNANMEATQGSGKMKFAIGETYVKEPKDNPRLCTSDGFHYCNKLKDVFRYYPLEDDNRFFEVEVLGSFTDGSDKSTTTSIKILKEIPRDTLLDEMYAENLNLKLVADIQKQYPMFHIGGSVGLFLHGVRLKRWAKPRKADLDFVSPYFVLPDKTLKLSDGEETEVLYLDAKASGNDFDETFVVDDVKVDYRIDPKQRYEIIEFDGVKYKVSSLMTILEAKMRYAQNPNGNKHKEDIMEMVVTKKPKEKEKEVILPF